MAQFLHFIRRRINKMTNKISERIDELWSGFSSQKTTKEDCSAHLCVLLCQNAHQFKLFRMSIDEREDFSSWMYTRMIKIVEHFKDEGIPFSAYLQRRLYWSSTEYVLRHKDHEKTEHCVWQHHYEEAQNIEPDEEVIHDDIAVYITNNQKRQVLILSLKCSFLIPDHQIPRIAQSLAMEPSELQEMIYQLRYRLSEKEIRYKDLQMNIESQFLRAKRFEQERLNCQAGSIQEQQLYKKEMKHKKRLENMRKRLAKMRRKIPNKDIAQILHISKSSVDSAVSSLSRKAKRLEVSNLITSLSTYPNPQTVLHKNMKRKI
jgi:hypothetical protein